jgi:hypothetical protein
MNLNKNMSEQCAIISVIRELNLEIIEVIEGDVEQEMIGYPYDFHSNGTQYGIDFFGFQIWNSEEDSIWDENFDVDLKGTLSSRASAILHMMCKMNAPSSDGRN